MGACSLSRFELARAGACGVFVCHCSPAVLQGATSEPRHGCVYSGSTAVLLAAAQSESLAVWGCQVKGRANMYSAEP